MCLGRLDSLSALGIGVEQEQVEAEAEDEEDKKPPSRQNMLLRGYFRRQYESFAGDGVSMNRTFTERYVDRQIDHLLEQTEQRLAEMNRYVRQTCSDWQLLLEAPDDDSQRRTLKRTLEGLEDVADRLGDRLGPIFWGLNTKGELPPIPDPDDKGAAAALLGILKEEARAATESVEKYLFKPSHIVSVESLRGDDILVRLYRVEKLAGGFRKKM